MRLHVVHLVLASTVLAAAGCSASTEPVDRTPAPDTVNVVVAPDDVDPARLDPLRGLPDCPEPPPADATAEAADLPLPEQAVLTAASVDGPLLNVQGYSERTPVEIMVAYLRLEDWTVLSAEDEVFEAEILLERDGLRVFAKAQATCERGSAFVLFGSRDPELVPAPQGAGVP